MAQAALAAGHLWLIVVDPRAAAWTSAGAGHLGALIPRAADEARPLGNSMTFLMSEGERRGQAECRAERLPAERL